MSVLIQVAVAALLMGMQGEVVREVVVEGLSVRQTEEVVAASGLRVGEAADKAAVAEAAGRLMRTGWFQRVNWRWQPGPEGVRVTFRVVERAAAAEAGPAPAAPRPKIGMVRFTGLRTTPEGRLWAALRGVVEGRDYEEEDFRHILESLLMPVFGELGVWDVKFGRIGVEGEDPATLTVEVEEGRPLKLEAVDWKEGEPGWVDAARFPVGLTASRRRVDEAVIRLRQRLAGQGYLRAEIGLARRVEGDRLWLDLEVKRGAQYRFGELRIRGLEAAAETRARGLWKAAPGAVASPEVVEQWIAAVFAAGLPPGRGVRRELVHREGETVVDVEVEFPR